MLMRMINEPSTQRPHTPSPEQAPDPARTTAVHPHGLTAFLVIAFAFSWTAWWAAPQVIPADSTMPFVVAGGFGPMVAAVVVTAATQGGAGVRALFRRYSIGRRGGAVPYLIGALALVAIAAAAALPVYTGIVQLDEPALRAALMTVPVQFLVIALAGGGNEELGWRGFAQPRLQGVLTPLGANVVLGIVWAVWHAPLFSLAGTMQSQMSFPAYTMLCVGLTIVLAHVFNSARGGVLAAVVVHAAVNVVSGLKAVVVHDPAGVTEVALVLLAAGVLVLATRGRLGLRPA
ncbi:CPBP family intramembrane metalloprotease [Nocardiopsis sp. HNM0947]|uniref:CPBP family intramembrane metalloprotease n=1 Tax=Nocardiopsis coralli TaxID=2772213 RepID=A0ABR9P3F0_9ACTN|nr:type II CAAX endopeptidase family protein [Nocardiopsis coralli]MBE2998339.1 CPBP family intramembrane metalloprotease [Nocardiopsis coralli]